MSGVLVITKAKEFVSEMERTLPGQRVRGHIVQGADQESLRADLRRAVDAATGVVDGKIDVDIVIVDGEFVCGDGSSVDVTEPLYEDLPDGAGSLLDMLLGAGLPVLVDHTALGTKSAFQVGRCGARLFDRAGARQEVQEALAAVPFNRATLAIENDFARVYDVEELKGAATVSAILSENDFVISQLRDFVNEHQGPLRILDLGCGTGRFEELLLTDPKIRANVGEIVAVDFAPRYLVEARKRLAHFLRPREMKKIRFLRRVAEDLHWPAGYFDVVLASFGVVCFSRSHLTLQQVAHATKPGGLAMFNGYNRSALTYDFDEKLARTNAPETHFAIHIDKQANVMHLGSSMIDCMTFDVDAFENLLPLVGLTPRSDQSRTFPTFYGAVRRNYLTELVADAGRDEPDRHNGCQRPGPACGNHFSYQEENLVGHREHGFHDLVHKMDSDLSRVIERKGFYFSVAAFKEAA